jgi:hypothetical protein
MPHDGSVKAKSVHRTHAIFATDGKLIIDNLDCEPARYEPSGRWTPYFLIQRAGQYGVVYGEEYDNKLTVFAEPTLSRHDAETLIERLRKDNH